MKFTSGQRVRHKDSGDIYLVLYDPTTSRIKTTLTTWCPAYTYQLQSPISPLVYSRSMADFEATFEELPDDS